MCGEWPHYDGKGGVDPPQVAMFVDVQRFVSMCNMISIQHREKMKSDHGWHWATFMIYNNVFIYVIYTCLYDSGYTTPFIARVGVQRGRCQGNDQCYFFFIRPVPTESSQGSKCRSRSKGKRVTAAGPHVPGLPPEHNYNKN